MPYVDNDWFNMDWEAEDIRMEKAWMDAYTLSMILYFCNYSKGGGT